MSQTDDPVDGSGAQAPPPLPADVREHIGRRLRSTYTVEADKPAFLGDAAIPPQFERYVRELERGERSGREGLRAVSQALGLQALGVAEQTDAADEAAPPAVPVARSRR